MIIRQRSLMGSLFFILAFFIGPVFAIQVPAPLVDTAWLTENIDKVVLLDVRTDVRSFEKRPKGASAVNPCGVGSAKGPIKVAGHIPGAVLIPWNKTSTKRKVEGTRIQYLVPDKEAFERLMQKSGVNGDSAVVITSKGEAVIHTSLATRLYWTLKYFGFDNVALLNGGTAQWIKDKQKIKLGKSRAEKGNFKATAERKDILATTDDVVKLSQGQGDEQLVDARSTAEYLGLNASGKVAPGVKGHVAGAKSFPVFLLSNAMGPATVYDKERLQKVAELLGVDTGKPTIAMCNSGVFASTTWFLLHELKGNKMVRLYDGSMHEWSHLGKPVVSMKIE
ncbi:MAG: hypothetical protein KZQ94_19565 [Candidatus Thiodiazotropha sp. (ex Troendleina suluensis)]|nr:hypothetical protein [Candidatus Thiodiazotropha sp. (ex Troendleina suluensis)]